MAPNVCGWPLAQLVEPSAHNRVVDSSILSGPICDGDDSVVLEMI